jgi:hypothetical protein
MFEAHLTSEGAPTCGCVLFDGTGDVIGALAFSAETRRRIESDGMARLTFSPPLTVLDVTTPAMEAPFKAYLHCQIGPPLGNGGYHFMGASLEELAELPDSTFRFNPAYVRRMMEGSGR